MSSTSYEAVKKFEDVIAEYTGAKYAVAVDSCCNALFLCCKYSMVTVATIPKRTYPGVACAIINSGGKVEFADSAWVRSYQLKPYKIHDCALLFEAGMYVKGSLMCLSFHVKKPLPIGRGGMILTDSKKAADWFRKARFDGRSECSLADDNINMVGWNMYMTPEQASRGLLLFETGWHSSMLLFAKNQGYPDLSKIKAYK